MDRHFLVRLVALVVLYVTVTHGAPVNAQSPALELAPLHSVRIRTLRTFNGQPLAVCQVEMESVNRQHGACRHVATAQSLKLVAGHLVERVMFDDKRYERFDEETTWSASENPDYDPNAPTLLNDYLYNDEMYGAIAGGEGWEQTLIGPEVLADIPTTHYQFWSTDAERNASEGGQLVYDLWLSNDNRVIADAVTIRGTRIAGLGEGTLSDLWMYTDHNAPMTIGLPPADRATPAP